MVKPEIQVGSRRVFEGRVVNLRVDEVRLRDGRSATREVVEHRGAAVVVPLARESQVLMVRQFRYVIGEVLLELPAGTLEVGEDPLACAQRELHEEVGARAGRWEPLGAFYSAPGVLTELLHVFLATDLVLGTPQATPDEDLAVVRLPLPEAVDLVVQGEIRDAKSAAGLLVAARRLGR